MKRKILISSLILVFFVATTGLPITVHICNMMENVSMEKCEFHSHHAKKMSCCDENVNDGHILKSNNPSCCEIKTVDKSVKDNFITFQTEVINNLSFVKYILIDNQTSDIKYSLTQSFHFTDSSPPGTTADNLYLNNSILLI